jgi:hypothetical protein
LSDLPGNRIDGDSFATALVSGFHRVMSQQELLNRINVFPVADGDTGTNLSLSLSSALGVLQGGTDKHLGTMLAAVADVLLDGARGNSGAIVAQFTLASNGDASRMTKSASGIRSSNPARSSAATPTNTTTSW